jgi:hypothetical protein
MNKQTLTDVKLPIGQSEKELLKIAEKKLRARPAYFKILKKSLDARDKNNIRYVYTIEFSAEQEKPQEKTLEQLPKYKLPEKPVVVVGSGPAGLFCAIRLIDRGITRKASPALPKSGCSTPKATSNSARGARARSRTAS